MVGIEAEGWIAIIVLCILCIIWLGASNKLVKYLARGMVCSLLLLVMNVLLPSYAIALNGYTIGFSALLGIPGVMTLFVMKMIL